MQVITTHINADFDGLAAMIAAKKLYPEAILAFSGSQEKNLREFIAQNLLYQVDFHKARDLDLTLIDTLIIVDTRSSERIGAFAACLNNPGLQLHLYDHHPKSPGDLTGSLEKIADVGATATILTQILKDRDIALSADEATILCLGIYEDTGSLTHLTTTPEDLEAAAWLLRQGAKLEVVTQFTTYELTSQQVELLHTLRNSAHQYTIQDIAVTVVALSLPEYVDDFALIIRRFMTMENLDTLFALLSMAERTYLIARSRLAEVNAGLIARDLGGGGHASAAAATIRDMTLIEAQEKLIQSLHRHIQPQPIAREMMSTPAIVISANTSLADAHTLMNRYSIAAAPVIASGRQKSKHGLSLVGIITRVVIEKALHHELGHLPVSEYMTTDVAILSLNATLADIQELIIENRQRLIPIIQDGELAGVITRTDLLNRLVNDPSHIPRDLLQEADNPLLERRRNLSSHIADCLTKTMVQLLQLIGQVADELHYTAFAAGGFVRDLLLRKRTTDLDVVVEGNGLHFAKILAERLGGRYRTHERFATAVVIYGNGQKIDVATARLEYYEYPAALPTVELSSIKLDLYRRDFTINAMAIQLNLQHFGVLIDFFNCQNDLKRREIKVLHNLSFVEDPSRVFRAIRFEKRMEFTIAPHTVRLMRNAVKMKLFGKGHDIRLFLEMQHIFSEENPLPAIERLAEFDLFQFLWPDLKPSLKIDRRFLHILQQAHRAVSWFKLLYLDEQVAIWMVYLLAVMARCGLEELKAFCQRFQLPPKTCQHLLWQKDHADRSASLLARRHTVSNSEVYWLLQQLSNEGLLYLMALSRKNMIKKAVSNYVTELQYAKTDLNGRDLLNLGYSAGPDFKNMLNSLLDARLNGQVTDREEELAYIRQNFPLPDLS